MCVKVVTAIIAVAHSRPNGRFTPRCIHSHAAHGRHQPRPSRSSHSMNLNCAPLRHLSLCRPFLTRLVLYSVSHFACHHYRLLTADCTRPFRIPPYSLVCIFPYRKPPFFIFIEDHCCGRNDAFYHGDVRPNNCSVVFTVGKCTLSSSALFPRS
jgi:hypothetical protein